MKKLVAILLLLAIMMSTVITSFATNTVTSIGLSEHGLKAYNDDWQYLYGGKGQVVDGHRVSDCAGLIYAYFSDNKVSGCYGGCTGIVNNNCVFSSKIGGKGVPNIHGLLLTMYDTVDPQSGLYGHIGIYIGGLESVDNSTYGVNMVKAMIGTRNWSEWHLMDLGMLYPENGWYAVDGKMCYYRNCQYIADGDVDGILLDSDGYAVDEDGSYLEVDEGMLDGNWVSASRVKESLEADGWLNNGGQIETVDTNAIITGDSVRMRSAPSLTSTVYEVLGKQTKVQILEEVRGTKVTAEGKTSDIWYKIRTQQLREGYVSSIYVYKDDNIAGYLNSPYFSYQEGVGVLIYSPDDVSIYYSTDCTEPSELYLGPINKLGCTYRAVCIYGDRNSDESMITITSNGKIFKDFTFNDWFAQKVDTAVSEGLFVGTGHEKFTPNGDITRGQFMLVLARMIGVDLNKYDGVTDFTDVGSNQWYAKAVDWAEDEDIVAGIGNNKFAPNDSITREQVCKIIARAQNWYTNDDIQLFADDNKISSWAKDAVYACRQYGVVNGVGNNNFNPKGKLTRAEGATVAVNSLKYFE